MSSRHQLEALLAHPDIWYAGGGRDTQAELLSTGWPKLDQALSGGWPLACLCELLTPAYGLGEFRLLLPALSRLTAEDAGRKPAYILFVNPPYIPYAPALLAAGLDVSRLLTVNCQNDRELCWVLDQAVGAGVFVAVLAWCAGIDEALLRRLQLTAEKAACWVMLLRPERFCRQRSPASLRLLLKPLANSGFSLDIFKQRGHRPQRLLIPD